jgi:hypothetical protein
MTNREGKTLSGSGKNLCARVVRRSESKEIAGKEKGGGSLRRPGEEK